MSQVKTYKIGGPKLANFGFSGQAIIKSWQLWQNMPNFLFGVQFLLNYFASFWSFILFTILDPEEGALDFGMTGVVGQQLDYGSFGARFFSKKGGQTVSSRVDKVWPIFQAKHKFGHIFEKI